MGLGIGIGISPCLGGGVMSPPVNSVAPAVTGTGFLGMAQSTDDGTWSGSPTFTYLWQLSANGSTGWTDSAITRNYYFPDATGCALVSSYTPYVRCKVTATNAVGSTVAYSNSVQMIYNASANPACALNFNALFSQALWKENTNSGNPAATHPSGTDQIAYFTDSSKYATHWGMGNDTNPPLLASDGTRGSVFDFRRVSTNQKRLDLLDKNSAGTIIPAYAFLHQTIDWTICLRVDATQRNTTNTIFSTIPYAGGSTRGLWIGTDSSGHLGWYLNTSLGSVSYDPTGFTLPNDSTFHTIKIQCVAGVIHTYYESGGTWTEAASTKNHPGANSDAPSHTPAIGAYPSGASNADFGGYIQFIYAYTTSSVSAAEDAAIRGSSQDQAINTTDCSLCATDNTLAISSFTGIDQFYDFTSASGLYQSISGRTTSVADTNPIGTVVHGMLSADIGRDLHASDNGHRPTWKANPTVNFNGAALFNSADNANSGDKFVQPIWPNNGGSWSEFWAFQNTNDDGDSGQHPGSRVVCGTGNYIAIGGKTKSADSTYGQPYLAVHGTGGASSCSAWQYSGNSWNQWEVTYDRSVNGGTLVAKVFTTIPPITQGLASPIGLDKNHNVIDTTASPVATSYSETSIGPELEAGGTNWAFGGLLAMKVKTNCILPTTGSGSKIRQAIVAAMQYFY